MIEISLTVIVCALTVVAAAGLPENARSCEVYTETRPMVDLRSCLYRPLRDQLGREAVERTGRDLGPEETVETTCRLMTSGSGIPTG
jgi:hypothetical protein